MKTAVSLLLVDDEERNLTVLESLLQSHEYHLVRASSADRALALLIDQEFAAIVLDVQMPGMSGIELAHLIKQRKRTQHIPIIFLTAHVQENRDILQGYGIGAVDYLTKPIHPEILRSKVAVFVDLFRKTRDLAATNFALESEIAQREKADEALRLANEELESRVQQRTADLSAANEELRRREAALIASQTQALEASRAKDDFLAMLSHELRTPLNPVLLLASESASDPSLPREMQAQFEMISRNVQLEARLIDDLLDITRISRGKLTLDVAPCDLHKILPDAVSMVDADVQQKGIAIEVNLRADRAAVNGDDVRLKQIFWNLLKNSVRFTPEGGHIYIESRTSPDGAEIWIKFVDTGIGLTPKEMSRIFETFAQGDHATEPGPQKFGGMGLGLAISRKLAELHWGSISVESPGRGRGATFLVKLPLAPSGSLGDGRKPAAVPSSLPAADAEERPRRLLLVEDHEPTRVVLARLLVRRDFEVTTATSVAEACSIAGERAFDLLISDIGLPDGNGNDLMTELQGRVQGLVGIALTGYGTEEDHDRSRKSGFIAHLTKPVSAEALDRALAKACERMRGLNSCQP